MSKKKCNIKKCSLCTDGAKQKGKNDRCYGCLQQSWVAYHKKASKNDPILYRLRHSLADAKKRAKRKSIKFELSIEFLLELWQNQKGRCFYTGIKMETPDYHSGSGKQKSVSIDRLDSSEGYTESNVVLCCYMVNVSKNELKYHEWLNICKKIIDYGRKHNIRNTIKNRRSGKGNRKDC